MTRRSAARGPSANARSLALLFASAALVLIVHIGLRAAGLFGPPSARPLILMSFLFLWISPWIVLSPSLRTRLALRSPLRPLVGFSLFASGAALALTIGSMFFVLYGSGSENAFESVRASYFSGAYPPLSAIGLFALFTVPAMIFSPIGEELFCRGVLVEVGSQAVGYRAGVVLSALVFATAHLVHHGIFVSDGAVVFRAASGALWFLSMIAASLLFSFARRFAGTIWASVVCHAGFNLGMNTFIFLRLMA